MFHKKLISVSFNRFTVENGHLEKKILVSRESAQKILNTKLKTGAKEYEQMKKDQVKSINAALKEEIKALNKKKAGKAAIKGAESKSKQMLDMQLAKQDADFELQQVSMKKMVEADLCKHEEQLRADVNSKRNVLEKTIKKMHAQRVAELREKHDKARITMEEQHREEIRLMAENEGKAYVEFLRGLQEEEVSYMENMTKEITELLNKQTIDLSEFLRVNLPNIPEERRSVVEEEFMGEIRMAQGQTSADLEEKRKAMLDRHNQQREDSI